MGWCNLLFEINTISHNFEMYVSLIGDGRRSATLKGIVKQESQETKFKLN